LEITFVGCDEQEHTNGTSSLLGGDPKNILEAAHLTLGLPEFAQG